MLSYIKVRGKRYYFNDTNMYVAGENEKWLADKSKVLGLSDLQAAAKLIVSGEMEGLKGDNEFETTIYIKYSGCNPFGFDPRFVSIHNFNFK